MFSPPPSIPGPVSLLAELAPDAIHVSNAAVDLETMHTCMRHLEAKNCPNPKTISVYTGVEEMHPPVAVCQCTGPR